ncbi:MAG: transketolase [Proteobacteria bacterium]|jgi:transketolase|nr:transketolase [Pseudomonadota bacterium]
MTTTVDARLMANAIRILSADAVQQANSGHPGAPMGMADIAEVLWNRHLKHNPANPGWHNRDRFVLSNGHASMLIYSLLHLSGYDLSIEDIKSFRQFESRTAGHPEYSETPGVETTTGPLGQGIANAVGFALAEKVLAAQFNKEGYELVDHRTWIFLGDGCLMEGISHEACSLAGTLELGKLVAFWDDNHISIDGPVDGWFTDDTAARFEAYGWHVIRSVDGHDADAIDVATKKAMAETGKPSLICCRTTIGYGAPNKQGSAGSHGAPLGDEEIQLLRDGLDWPHAAFEIPDEISQAWNACERGKADEAEWQESYSKYASEFPAEAEEYQRRMTAAMPANWASLAAKFIADTQAEGPEMATRKSSQRALEYCAGLLPELIGGSADLTGSNNTNWSGSKAISADDAGGNYINYGVREFAMVAIMNGLALHGGFKPYAGTFLVFSDYARNAIRMAALMKQPTLLVFTHDSIGLGEDGPTHQPVEHMASLRLIPNSSVWRPCDAVESAVAWKFACESTDQPVSMVYSRQTLPHMNRDDIDLADIEKGGYVLNDCEGLPELIIIATGSEVGIAHEAATQLRDGGVKVRLVSMPSSTVFDQQDDAYREAVLPAACDKRLAVEAGSADFWWKYVGLKGAVIGMESFGASAPAAELFEYFGFTVDNVLRQSKSLLA